MAKTVRQPWQKCTFSASGTKRRKFCLEKKYQFSKIFWFQGGSFRTFSGIFQKIVKIGVFVSKEKFWIKKCLSSKKVFVSFLNFWAQPFSDFWLEVFGNDFQNCNYLSIATSSWRTFPLKKVFFPHSSSVFKRKFSVFSAKILQQIWHKCILYVPRNNWCNTNFLKIKDLTQWLRIFSGLLLRFDKKLQQSCQNFTIYTKSTFEEKHFVWAKVYLQIFFRTANGKFLPDFLNIFQRFQRKFFTEKKTFLFKKSCLFPVNAEISSGYLVETFWQNVQNCISIVHRSIIPGKNSFFENVDFFSNLDLEQIFFISFAATFRQLRENCNPSVHRNILKK